MIPFIVSLVGMLIATLLAIVIFEAGRAALRKMFQDVAKSDAEREEKNTTG